MDPVIYLNVIETDFLGLIGISISPRGLLRLRMFQESRAAYWELNSQYQEGQYLFSEAETKAASEQIRAYLRKELQSFDIPIDWSIYTDFQRAVLKKTYQIPYGETRSYGEIAAAIGNPLACRAVGQAEKRNDLPLVIPCHRVIGSDGSLTGYAGKENLDLKARILAFEKAG
jgi:methylated-DNA-[protein]-cysteine S-methyltransferase